MKKIALLTLLLLLLSGCATTSKIASKLSPAMNKDELIKQCGKPQRKELKENKELWVYKERLWTKTGYPFTLITQVSFQDDKVVEFSQTEEHPPKPTAEEQEARNKAWRDFADAMQKEADRQREESNKAEQQRFQNQLDIWRALGQNRRTHCTPDRMGGWYCQ